MELFIARHGETEANAGRRVQGSGVDTPLTEKGISQAKMLGKSVEGMAFDAIYSSPLKRAMDTARIAFGQETQILTDKRLVEVGLGDAEGMTWEEFHEIYQGDRLMLDPPAYIPPPNGEHLKDMIARMDSFLMDLANLANSPNSSKSGYKRVFVLAHGYVLRVVYACSVDKSVQSIIQSPRYENCQLARYVLGGSKWSHRDLS